MSAHDKPDLETVIESDDPALEEQYNDVVDAELEQRVEKLEQKEKEAFGIVADDATVSLGETEVDLPGGHTVTVKDRITKDAGEYAEGATPADMDSVDLAHARRQTAKFLGEMCVDDGFTEDMWLAAYEANNVGFSYLAEVIQSITDEMGTEGNPNTSNSPPNQTAGKQSGQWQKR